MCCLEGDSPALLLLQGQFMQMILSEKVVAGQEPSGTRFFMEGIFDWEGHPAANLDSAPEREALSCLATSMVLPVSIPAGDQVANSTDSLHRTHGPLRPAPSLHCFGSVCWMSPRRRRLRR
jgi:hypothetical protein